nr:reverse transcriptase domain-containing protein [Tanacetum cinerariifolium]
RSKQPFILEESPVDMMADQRTMAELLRAPIEGYAEAIVVLVILAEQFKLKHSLINMMTLDQFFGPEKDNPHDHIRWFNRITSTIKYKDVPNSAIKLMLFPFSLVGAACRWLEKESPCSIHIWEDLVSKFINEFFPPQEQQISIMKSLIFNNAILKQFQATPPLASVKAVEEICVTCGGAHPYYQCLAADSNTFPELTDNIQGYVSAVTVNYNQGNSVYRHLGMANPIRPPGFDQPNVQNNQNQFSQPQGYNRGSRSLPSNTVSNPKGELKAITTQSGLVLDGPSILTPPFINPEEDERVEETLTDQDLSEYTIKRLSSRSYPEKLRDLGKFLIPYGFNELKCKSLANLGASINLMPLSVWKKLGLPELIFTRMTLELANRAICTPTGIARDVFVLVGKFTFPDDLVIVDYESDPRVSFILERPFLRTARALIDVHGGENILRDESPVDMMADQRTMAELLRAPIEGYAEAIVVLVILAEQFKLKHSLINMMTLDQFFGPEKDNPHDHIRWFNKITSTIKYKDVPNSAIKLMLFSFSLAGVACRWLEKESLCSIHIWEDLVSKFINEFFPPQEPQISVMKSLIFNNSLMNRFMRHGIDTKISFVHALIMVTLNCTNLILSTMP